MSRRRTVVGRAIVLAMGLSLGATARPGPAQSATSAPEAGLDGSPTDETGEADAPGAAASPDKEQARAIAEEGRQLYWKGEYEAAIEAFTSAYELSDDPNLLFNVSAAYEKLEDYDRAIEFLDRYESDAPAEESDAIAAKRDQLRRARASDAESEPVRPEGPDPTTPAPPPTPSKGAPVMGALGWSFVGVAVAGIGFGTGFGLSASSKSKAAESDCVSVGGDVRCPVGAESGLARARTHAIIADVSFGIAAAATVAALTVLGVRLARRKKNGHGPEVALGRFGAAIRF